MIHKVLLGCFAIVAFILPAYGQDEMPQIRETFEVAGHTAFIYAAPKPTNGKPWLWFAPTLKGISLVQRNVYYDSFLKAGISIAGFDIGEVRGSPSSTAKFTLFYHEMVKRGWSDKPILLGQSRGGLMMLGWGTRHPDKVKAFVGIYPVCSLTQWPMKSPQSAATTIADYGLSESELRARFNEFNPIDNLHGLLANRVPMFVVHGDSDTVVTFEDNTRILKERYEAGGGKIEVKVVPGEGHAVSPSYFECQELIEFVLKHASL